ncbi:hypothetical protein CRP01_09915 [Flavilitoribacter nigricans DSM 23189 = NBRC 102662]|uniref:Outer membrane protein beta-barrel domain-containing protein n=2 Tax=Flavilitoribacter TaxID=2762562 RepID=A0A2D0NDQ4_FLAN2|nr:hypothetical protein CRP01_09915 [Flavilitoribacter nigricans DSM 23189 = NBRC 102662]
MLDREMPVDGSSRKPVVFWWFWLAAAVLLIGTVGFIFLRPVGSSEINASLANGPAEKQERVADTTTDRERTSTTSSTVGQEEVANERPDKQSEAGRTVAAETTGSRTPAAASSKKDAIIEVETTEERRISGSAFPLAQNTLLTEDDQNEETGGPLKNDQRTVDKTSNKENNSNKDQAVSESPADANNADRPLPEVEVFVLDQLPGEEIAALDQEPLPLSRINIYNPKKPLFVPFEINGGVLAGVNGNAIGLMTELRTGLKLNDAGKWSVQSGIGFHVQREPFLVSFRPSSQKDLANEQASLDSQNNSDPVAQDPGFNSVSEAVESSKVKVTTAYLDVPILLDWQFSRTWGVAAGVRMSWLQKTSWKGVSNNPNGSFLGAGLDVTVSNSSRQYVLYQYGNGNYAAPTSLVLNKFFTSGTLGVTFRPNARWNVRLQYQHSLTNQLDNPVYQKTDRSLWLSTGFRF